MREVPIDEIEHGLILAKEIVDSNDKLLLSKGSIIKKEHIRKLIENNISTIYVVDSVEDEVMDSFSIEKIEEESLELIQKIIENRIKEDGEDDMKKISATAEVIIRDILKNPEIGGCMVNIKRRRGDMYSHMLNTSVLSVIMAIKLGFSEEELRDIATGALLHDLGICNVSVKFENIDMDRMPAEEKLDYRRHVFKGYEMLKGYPWMTENSKAIVLSHHERQDGSGYPFHKRGKDIPRTVRLVSICDTFDELVNGIGYKKKKVHEVVEHFRTTAAYSFDYELLSKITANIAWFPTGSVVITNEGETAVIVKQNKGLPDRPIIKIIKDIEGNPVENGEVKNLLECLTIFIVDTIEED